MFTDAAAVPDNAELFVTPITKETNTEQYHEVKARINDSVQAENQLVTSFLAYDIYFMADGIEYEPELGSVNVTIQYKNEILDNSIKSVSDEIKVLHLKETAEGILVEDVTQEVALINFGEYIPANNSEKINNEGNANSGTDSGSETGMGSGIGSGTEVGTGSSIGSSSGLDVIKFVANSFSTFVVTGISNIKPVINVTM